MFLLCPVHYSMSDVPMVNDVSIICDLLDQIWRLQSQIRTPVPTKVLMFRHMLSVHSPFMKVLHRDERCAKWRQYNSFPSIHNMNGNYWSMLPMYSLSDLHLIEWNMELNLKGSLIVIECSDEHQLGLMYCFQFIKFLAQLNRYYLNIAKRMFFLVLVHYSSLAKDPKYLFDQTVSVFFEEKDLMKSHAAVIQYNWNQKTNQFDFARVGYVRPLENVCFVKQAYLEQSELTINNLTRHLLAIDHNNQKIKCNFQNTTLVVGINPVCFQFCCF